jgi:hypothetical protein
MLALRKVLSPKDLCFFKHESREKGEARNSKLTEQEITSFPHMYLYKITQLKVEM